MSENICQRDPSESEEHFELRRRFVERWKDDFPEDRLICLARVFCNVELLGCRYSDAVMKRIAHLSAEVAADFRAKRKRRLQRTFVSASQAAGDKVKRAASTSQSSSDRPIVFENPKRAKMEQRKPYPSRSYGNLILYDRQSSFISRINDSCQTCKVPLDWQQEKVEDQGWRCTCVVNGVPTFAGTGATQKLAKDDTAENAWKVLQKECYTIQAIQKHVSKDNQVISADSIKSDSNSAKDAFDTKVESSVASRMMKLMGWKGGGLGAAADGRHEPIVPNVMQISRAGLGSSNSENKNIRKALLKTIVDFKNSNETDYDLVFKSDFTKDERKELHNLAQRNGLKSKSYGSDEDRYLVISKPVNPAQLLYALLECGGENEKFKLIHPTE